MKEDSWGSNEESREEDRDNEKGSKDSPRESDMLCDCSHVPLHCQIIKERKNQKKRNIKSRKIDKRKEKF